MKNDYKNSLVHIPLHLYYCIVQGGPNGKVLASAETVTIILLNRAWRLFNTHSTTSYRINDPVRLFFFMIFFQPVFPILKYYLLLEYLWTFIHFLDFLPVYAYSFIWNSRVLTRAPSSCGLCGRPTFG